MLNKSQEFALVVFSICKTLLTQPPYKIYANQIIRSSSSIGAHVRESQHAESKKDFIHKLAIAQKECAESIYWLELLYKTKALNKTQFTNTNEIAIENMKLLTAIIIKSKRNSINH
ncbi:MAG: four helix bundle protein [Bacteroidia bacterium]